MMSKKIQQVESLFEFSEQASRVESDVDVLRRAMGTMQHHDAVTGTEKQHVAEDYAQRMRYTRVRSYKQDSSVEFDTMLELTNQMSNVTIFSL